MRKISSKERLKAGHIYCRYCKPQKVDAIWRADGSFSTTACDNHKGNIQENVDDRNMTEADYQTWNRI